jgi:hypothetical protein
MFGAVASAAMVCAHQTRCSMAGPPAAKPTATALLLMKYLSQ